MSLRLQIALNGAREHPHVPRTPAEIAAEASAAVAVGGESLHFHPFNEDGEETLEATQCAAAIRAVRAACPGISISLSTSTAIEPDPQRRHDLIAAWTELPDLVTVNQGEEGAVRLVDLLASRDVGIEAGLLALEDAHAFVAAEIAPRCVRAMVEPLDAEPEQATGHAAAIEAVLADADIRLPQIHHGDGIASWAVNRRAVELGHGIRTGLEDTGHLPDGTLAQSNSELAVVAASLLAEATRPR